MTRLVLAFLLASALSPLLYSAQRSMPPLDPNRDAAWTWNDQGPQALYSRQPGQSPVRTQAKLPFACPGNRVSVSRGEVYPEDGWLLVHRDFGTEGDAPRFPYFTLYNRYRGLFRVMVFNGAQLEASLLVGSLRQLQQAAPIFTFTNTQGQGTLSEYDATQVEFALSPMTQADGWAVFDFQLVGYDPDLDQKDPLLLFSFRRLALGQLDLNATEGLRPIKNLELTPGFGLSPTGFGEGPAHLQQRGYRQYRTVQHWAEAEARNKRNRHAFWYQNFQLLAQAGTAANAPLVGILGGQVDAWLGGSDRACAWEPISFRGQLEGSLKEDRVERALFAVPLYLQPADREGQETEGHRPVQRIPWGVFNVETAPVLRERPAPGAPERELAKTIHLAAEPKLHLNPAMGLDLVAKSYQANVWSWERQPSGSWRQAYSGLLPISVRSGPTLGEYEFVQDLILTLNFKARQATRDADDAYTVIKRLPCVPLNLEVRGSESVRD